MIVASVGPIELHEKIIIWEDVPRTAGYLSRIDISPVNFVLCVQHESQRPLTLIGKVNTDTTVLPRTKMQRVTAIQAESQSW
jgi:hypothetical protein